MAFHKPLRLGLVFLEAVNIVHRAMNLGEVPSKLLIVFGVEEGTPNLVRREQHQTSDTTK